MALISYPYEWCFSQLKDAALLTLRLQRAAMERGMSLKDATAYNVQFDAGRPVWIDTLSFEPLRVDAPWVAYRQFCEFYVAPLALMRYTDVRLHQLLRTFLDGVPVDLASRLLPARTRLSIGLGVHIHLHAAAGRRAAQKQAPAGEPRQRRMPKHALEGLIDSLERTVKRLTWEPAGTVWGDYYDATNYTEAAFAHKRERGDRGAGAPPAGCWCGISARTTAPSAVSRRIAASGWRHSTSIRRRSRRTIDACVAGQERRIVPLVMDLTNPSPACGWAGQERQSLVERGPADLALALALVHHLAIAHNVPFDHLAAFFASVARALVIEFVPKDDSQVQRMLATREDVFSDYTQDAFERAFARRFQIEEATPVMSSRRTLYVMRRREA